MQIRHVLILACSLATLFHHGLGLSGIRPSQAKNSLSSLNNDLFQAVSVPNKWGYIVRISPDLSAHGLTFSLRVGLSLRRVETTSCDEAEALFCELYPDLLDKFNSLRTIRPLLASFPLDPDSCQLDVMFVDEHGWAVSPPFLAGVSLEEGSLEFFRHVIGKRPPYETIATRKAREVLSLKKLYQPSCHRTKASTPLQGFQFLQCSWKYDCPLLQREIKALEKLCSQTNLALTAVGTVGKDYFDSRPIEFALHGTQQLTLKEAQNLAKTCLQCAFDHIKDNQPYRQWIEKWTSPGSCQQIYFEPASDQIAFRINFWDENIDRPVAPYISEIRLLDNKLSYFTADENQCLVLAFEEDVDEAAAHPRPAA